MSNQPNRYCHWLWSESVAHCLDVYTVDDGTVAHGYLGPLTKPEEILDQYVRTYTGGNANLTMRINGEVIATRTITV